MKTDQELMQMALDTLERNLQVMQDDWHQIDQEWGPSAGGLQAAIDGILTGYEYFKDTISAITALRERLAQPEKVNQCGETCERAKLCATCAKSIGDSGTAD